MLLTRRVTSLLENTRNKIEDTALQTELLNISESVEGSAVKTHSPWHVLVKAPGPDTSLTKITEHHGFAPHVPYGAESPLLQLQ